MQVAKFQPHDEEYMEYMEYVAICTGGNRASGSTARVVELYEIYLADDGRTLTRESRKILGNGIEGSLDVEELSGQTSVVIEGVWHMLYEGTSRKASLNTIMGATGKLNKKSALPLKLK